MICWLSCLFVTAPLRVGPRPWRLTRLAVVSAPSLLSYRCLRDTRTSSPDKGRWSSRNRLDLVRTLYQRSISVRLPSKGPWSQCQRLQLIYCFWKSLRPVMITSDSAGELFRDSSVKSLYFTHRNSLLTWQLPPKSATSNSISLIGDQKAEKFGSWILNDSLWCILWFFYDYSELSLLYSGPHNLLVLKTCTKHKFWVMDIIIIIFKKHFLKIKIKHLSFWLLHVRVKQESLW